MSKLIYHNFLIFLDLTIYMNRPVTTWLSEVKRKFIAVAKVLCNFVNSDIFRYIFFLKMQTSRCKYNLYIIKFKSLQIVTEL